MLAHDILLHMLALAENTSEEEEEVNRSYLRQRLQTSQA